MGCEEKKTKNFLGIDIGTTSLKAAVFDADGNRKGVRAVDYTLDTDAETGFIEFNADEYINMCRKVIEELEAECGKIDALSVDTQGETLIFADADGNALCPAVVWLDNRGDKGKVRLQARLRGHGTARDHGRLACFKAALVQKEQAADMGKDRKDIYA